MITYVSLMDLLNHRGMKKTDLKAILSSKTIAKLSKNEYVSGEVIEKLCLFLKCQPGDIMTVVETCDSNEYKTTIRIHEVDYKTPNWQSDFMQGEVYGELSSWKDAKWDYDNL